MCRNLSPSRVYVTGTYAYETEFEFDLSDENEARLTGTHFSQMLGMPEREELQGIDETLRL